MNTGIKMLDKLITQHGIRTQAGSDGFQTITVLHGGDKRAVSMGLPYCFYQRIMAMPVSHTVKLHQVFLPYRQARLASFLVDHKGHIVEQVYYQRDAKNVKACRKVQQMVGLAHLQQWQLVA